MEEQELQNFLESCEHYLVVLLGEPVRFGIPRLVEAKEEPYEYTSAVRIKESQTGSIHLILPPSMAAEMVMQIGGGSSNENPGEAFTAHLAEALKAKAEPTLGPGFVQEPPGVGFGDLATATLPNQPKMIVAIAWRATTAYLVIAIPRN